MKIRYYVETWTDRPDKAVVIIRSRPFGTQKEAILELMRMVYEGFYHATNQMSPLVHAKPIEGRVDDINSLSFPKGLRYENDLGGTTFICLNNYGEKAQVKEGKIVL